MRDPMLTTARKLAAVVGDLLVALHPIDPAGARCSATTDEGLDELIELLEGADTPGVLTELGQAARAALDEYAAATATIVEVLYDEAKSVV